MFGLQPEFGHALEFIINSLDELEFTRLSTLQKSDWVEGKVYMCSGPISGKSIPSDSRWRWNQTKSRKKFFIPEIDAHVEFYKLCPRWRNPNSRSGSLPYYKVWYYMVSEKNEESPSKFIVWYEKGPRGKLLSKSRRNKKMLKESVVSPPSELLPVQEECDGQLITELSNSSNDTPIPFEKYSLSSSNDDDISTLSPSSQPSSSDDLYPLSYELDNCCSYSLFDFQFNTHKSYGSILDLFTVDQEVPTPMISL